MATDQVLSWLFGATLIGVLASSAAMIGVIAATEIRAFIDRWRGMPSRLSIEIRSRTEWLDADETAALEEALEAILRKRAGQDISRSSHAGRDWEAGQ